MFYLGYSFIYVDYFKFGLKLIMNFSLYSAIPLVASKEMCNTIQSGIKSIYNGSRFKPQIQFQNIHNVYKAMRSCPQIVLKGVFPGLF